MSARKLNYDGFEDSLIAELDKLFSELSLAYEKAVGRKFDIKNNKFLNETRAANGKGVNLQAEDREGMLSAALCILHQSKTDTRLVRVFKNYRFALALSIHSQNDTDKKILEKRLRSEAAKMRWLNDPVSEDKKFVKSCWLDWKKKPSNYKSKAAFARDMLNDKTTHLTSTKVIEDWCREWEKE